GHRRPIDRAPRTDLAAGARALSGDARPGAPHPRLSRAVSPGALADDHSVHRRARGADHRFQRPRSDRHRSRRHAAVHDHRAADARGAAVRTEADVEDRGSAVVSEYDNVGERRKRQEPAPEAKIHLAKWSPWIWIVPVLAVFLAGYFVVRYGFFGGGDITVHFAEARGLDRYSPVRFRGAKVGTVQKITIDDQLKQVVVRIPWM